MVEARFLLGLQGHQEEEEGRLRPGPVQPMLVQRPKPATGLHRSAATLWLAEQLLLQ